MSYKGGAPSVEHIRCIQIGLILEVLKDNRIRSPLGDNFKRLHS